MPLANVTALSDDDDTPKIDNQQGPGEELGKPKAKAKVTAEAKTKSTAKAKSAKSTAKAKAKAKSAAKKRPAAAQDPEDGQAGTSSAGGMKRPADLNPVLQQSDSQFYFILFVDVILFAGFLIGACAMGIFMRHRVEKLTVVRYKGSLMNVPAFLWHVKEIGEEGKNQRQRGQPARPAWLSSAAVGSAAGTDYIRLLEALLALTLRLLDALLALILGLLAALRARDLRLLEALLALDMAYCCLICECC